VEARQQAGDVLHRVVELCFGERAAEPVGARFALEELDADDRAHELLIAEPRRESGEPGGDLGVEQRCRNRVRRVPEDFHVLARRVGDLEHARVRERRRERLEGAQRQRIDEIGRATVADLHQTEARVERALAHELGVEGDRRDFVPARRGVGECGVGRHVNDREIGDGDAGERLGLRLRVLRRRLAQGVAPAAR
jgi:hypothetical protein